MPFDNSLKNLQTPERVRALCQLVEYAPYTREEVVQMLQPTSLNKSQDTSKQILTLALKGELVKEREDHRLISGMPPGAAKDPEQFRRAVIQHARQQPDLVFHRFTAWALGKGREMMVNKVDQLEILFFHEVSSKSTINREYNDTNIRGWMTWSAYLGYGFEHNGYFLVNPALRIEEELRFGESLVKGKPMFFRSFMQWLSLSIPELDGGVYHEQVFPGQKGKQQLSYALSAGLRTLHTQGIIKLRGVKDASDVWFLTPSKLHEISSAVTEITIVGGEQQ